MEGGKWWKTVGISRFCAHSRSFSTVRDRVHWKWSAFPGTDVDVRSTRIMDRWKTGGSRPLWTNNILLGFHQHQLLLFIDPGKYSSTDYELRLGYIDDPLLLIINCHFLHYLPDRSSTSVHPKCETTRHFDRGPVLFRNSERARERAKQRDCARSLLILP